MGNFDKLEQAQHSLADAIANDNVQQIAELTAWIAEIEAQIAADDAAFRKMADEA
jgi:hypothetical protein